MITHRRGSDAHPTPASWTGWRLLDTERYGTTRMEVLETECRKCGGVFEMTPVSGAQCTPTLAARYEHGRAATRAPTIEFDWASRFRPIVVSNPIIASRIRLQQIGNIMLVAIEPARCVLRGDGERHAILDGGHRLVGSLSCPVSRTKRSSSRTIIRLAPKAPGSVSTCGGLAPIDACGLPDGLPPAERSERIKRLEADRFRAEVDEESMIRRIEAACHAHVLRRIDADPMTILVAWERAA